MRNQIAAQVQKGVKCPLRNLKIPKKSFLKSIGAKIWNEMPASLRELPQKHFQMKLHSFLLDIFKKHDDYIDISKLTLL